ncbi:MAG TPA: alpha/beta fold hydrolase [Polyangiaceae bacterium]|nr:alpha/beta fold hydrolase [Polyangiaceae bacterium]
MARRLFLFAHGAGAPSSSAWMRAWAQRLETLGSVVSFDYPYMAARRRTPDKLPALVDAHRSALAAARQRHSGPIILIGKSMGGRVGCHLALEETVAGLVCLGYPLKGAGKSGKMRDEVLLALRTPVLFVQGTRDALCPLELLAEVRTRMQVPSELEIVESGDHSLLATKAHLSAQGITQAEVDAQVLAAIDAFTGAL